MTLKTELGGTGEELACLYLKTKEYKILQRNYRARLGEIDIITRSPEGILVFVEVKTMRDVLRKTMPPDTNDNVLRKTMHQNDENNVLRKTLFSFQSYFKKNVLRKTIRQCGNAANGNDFVESGNNEAIKPEDQMTAAKVKKFKKAVVLFNVKHPNLMDDLKGMRLDVVTILLPNDFNGNVLRKTLPLFFSKFIERKTLTEILKKCVVKHYENIF